MNLNLKATVANAVLFLPVKLSQTSQTGLNCVLFLAKLSRAEINKASSHSYRASQAAEGQA